jgi:hypothetical protein
MLERLNPLGPHCRRPHVSGCGGRLARVCGKERAVSEGAALLRPSAFHGGPRRASGVESFLSVIQYRLPPGARAEPSLAGDEEE